MSATAGVAALAALPTAAHAASGSDVVPAGDLPKPENSGIDHIVVLMQENRSFDHILGWLPGADGVQAGLSFRDRLGVPHATWRNPMTQCYLKDPDHSQRGMETDFNNGRCDGWLKAFNDLNAISYYTADQLDFFRQVTGDCTTCDRFFASTIGPTTPNRLYANAAQTDRNVTDIRPTRLTTIWDRLKQAGVSCRYYFSDAPFLALWGPRHLDISRPINEFYRDAAAGRLPAFSWIDPKYINEAAGTSTDDHPHADIRNGQYFMNHVYTALAKSPNWRNTLFIIDYDEAGGFFDHVAPGLAPTPNRWTNRRGFRIPGLVISPLARKGHIAHEVYDPTSILRAVEWRFGLEPLTIRDASARNLVEVLNLGGTPNLNPPLYNVHPGNRLLEVHDTLHETFWKGIGRLGHRYDFTVRQ